MHADVGFMVGDNFTSEGLHDSEMYRRPQTQTSRASSTFGDVDAVTGALEPLTVTLTECQLSASPVLS